MCLTLRACVPSCPDLSSYTCSCWLTLSRCLLLPMQLLFPVLGIGQEASPRGLRDSDSMITINVFDEVVTPTAASKATRAVARASNAGGCSPGQDEGPLTPALHLHAQKHPVPQGQACMSVSVAQTVLGCHTSRPTPSC